MTTSDIAKHRVINQHIAGETLKSPDEIVAWMGAMQAQDYAMSKWAIGVRLPGAIDELIDRTIDEGAIIRIHIMRPTWHLVAAKDVRWMMELTGPRIKKAMNTNNKHYELTEAVFNKCNSLIEKALGGGMHLTRSELMAILQRNKIATNDIRAILIMYRAEVEGIVCSGARKGKQLTYALFDERVPKSDKLDKDAAIAELLKRYMASHGPATIQDFVWWSGLTNADAKKGIELNKKDINSTTVDGQSYWFVDELPTSKKKKGSVHFLPAFDEYMVSYKDRSAALLAVHFSSAISGNGIFRPIIVADGNVIGTWDRTIKKDRAVIQPRFFDGVARPTIAALEKALQLYEYFLGQKTEIVY